MKPGSARIESPKPRRTVLKPKSPIPGMMTGAQLARAQGLTLETEAAAREASAAISDLTEMFDDDDYVPTEVIEPVDDGWPRGRGRRK